MVMGQEERKNKAKLEKTQIQLSSTSNEYEAAVKVLEETTGKWNRDWKAACDKFQDLEEERIDFMKASLWNFANIASTVCVSDDASCEKVRLSLEDCEVEKDICNFIKECGTGQEIPDPPKFINFCRGDADEASLADEDGNYSVAQFQRTMNPAFRSSSPQPSTFESHHDPANPVAMEQLHKDLQQADNDSTPRGTIRGDPRNSLPSQQKDQFVDVPKVPYNESPYEGMTQFCRPTSGQSSAASPVRPSSRDSQSEYSNPTSFSSVDPASGAQSPVKHLNGSDLSQNDDTVGQKRGFFKSHSPFRRRSKSEKETPALTPNGRSSTWGPASARNENVSPTKGVSVFGGNRMSASPDPDPVDPRANFQLNIGNNVFDVASPDARSKPSRQPAQDDLDPIAQALAELKGIDKQASVRQSADRYHGIATPAPPSSSGGTSTPAGAMRTPLANDSVRAAQRGTPPPSYDNPPVSRLGAPNPAFTAREMRQTTQQYVSQKQNMFNPSGRNSSSRPPTRGNEEVPRAASPAPPRAASPRPGMYDQQQQPSYRAPSPNPFQAGNNRPRAQSSSPVKPRNDPYGSWGSRGGSPGQQQMPRAASPQPYMPRQAPHPRAASPQPYAARQGQPPRAASPNPQTMRPGSSRGDGMALQLAPVPHDGGYGAAPRARGSDGGRPQSAYYGPGDESNGTRQVSTRVRSKSVADPNAMPNGGRFTHDGRPILHYGKSPVHSSQTNHETFTNALVSSRNVPLPSRHSGRAVIREGRHACCFATAGRRVVGSRSGGQEGPEGPCA